MNFRMFSLTEKVLSYVLFISFLFAFWTFVDLINHLKKPTVDNRIELEQLTDSEEIDSEVETEVDEDKP